MAFLTGNDRSRYVQKMFSKIAFRYDLMNTLITGGTDQALRREVIRLANLAPQDKVLDLGAGTGVLTREILHKVPPENVNAADFTFEMILAGKHWGAASRTCADALLLPFADEQYDVVVSGFLVRNVANLDQALSEQFRVLKPGGRLVILDATRPRKNLVAPLANLYLKYAIPVLGSLITGQTAAYKYLPESTINFLRAEDLTVRILQAGFINVNFKIRLLGTMAIHSAMRPAG